MIEIDKDEALCFPTLKTLEDAQSMEKVHPSDTTNDYKGKMPTKVLKKYLGEAG